MKNGLHRATMQDSAKSISEILSKDGFVLIEDVLPPEWVSELQSSYDDAVAEKARSEEGLADERHPPGWFEIARILERNETFENLMDVPKVLAVAGLVLGPDLDLASGGELDYKLPNQSANFCGWHTDFNWIISMPYPRQVFWLGCYFFVEDITPEVGPLTVMPGTHRSPEPPPLEHNYSGDDPQCPAGSPRPLAGAVDVVGSAGSCLMVNTELWHMSRPNESPRARKIVKVHYKSPWMKVWGGGREYTESFAARQDDPIRRQLVGTTPYDDVPWSFAPSESEIAARYPVARLYQTE